MAGKRSKEEIMAERLENTARRTEALEAEGYHAENATVSIVKANVMAFVIAVPFFAVFLILFSVLHSVNAIFEGVNGLLRSFLLLGAIGLSIPIHEGFHGLGWVMFCKDKRQSIQFGMMWESLTPYCHCREPLSVGQYYIGLLLPCTILGWIPCIAAVISGSGFWLAFGLFSILLAGGDLTIACIIAKYLGKDVKILDHPNECGAVAFTRAAAA